MQTAQHPNRHRVWLGSLLPVVAFACLAVYPTSAFAHGVSKSDQAFVQGNSGVNFLPFMYLGAKHMVTGYDHLLFLVGVIFLLSGFKQVYTYVTLFAIGHSTSLIVAVLTGTSVNAFLVDAIIAVSVVYKAFDNMDGFERLVGRRPNAKLAVLVFGLFHGFGLATRLQELAPAREGLLANLIAFNIGVEIGQVLALTGILVLMGLWRRSPSFQEHAFAANTVVMTAGFVLLGYQLVGYFVTS
jgi:hypothetical protein